MCFLCDLKTSSAPTPQPAPQRGPWQARRAFVLAGAAAAALPAVAQVDEKSIVTGEADRLWPGTRGTPRTSRVCGSSGCSRIYWRFPPGGPRCAPRSVASAGTGDDPWRSCRTGGRDRTRRSPRSRPSARRSSPSRQAAGLLAPQRPPRKGPAAAWRATRRSWGSPAATRSAERAGTRYRSGQTDYTTVASADAATNRKSVPRNPR